MQNTERTNRITEMEKTYDGLRLAFNSGEILPERDILTLNQYMESGLWLSDYEADERGELPTDLKRGVLSQDGLYNLLNDIETKDAH